MSDFLENVGNGILGIFGIIFGAIWMAVLFVLQALPIVIALLIVVAILRACG